MTSSPVHPRPRARLVLVHGTRLSHTQWALYADLLPGIQLVTPDLPSHGARSSQRFTLEAAVAVIEQAIGADDAVPTILAGHSLGGYMSLAYAEEHPQRLDGLVLMGASAEPRGVGAAAYLGLAKLLDLMGPERAGRSANWAMHRMLGADAADSVLAGNAPLGSVVEAWGAVLEGSGPGQLADVTCPVLLLNGQFDQLGVHAKRFVAAGRDMSVTTIPRASHLFPLTHAEETAQALRGFVDDVVARREGCRPGLVGE
ncbi:alpha/beta fold hydrolase [Janibacter sp. G56]|uniref:alpha/beta fold hydrolase n=1 Tax=Janibacter sp. G56 TaxID=3418717 RepID=UPI003CFD1920